MVQSKIIDNKMLKRALGKFYNLKLFYLILFIYLNLRVDRFAVIYYENYSDTEEIVSNLLHKTVNSSQMKDHGIQCEYTELLDENYYFYKKFTTEEVINQAEILQGGEYWPAECNPSFSAAIIVPYRARPNQLSAFLRYMHNFLRKQQIHYKIFIVEQQDSKPFNRAKLFNIGASRALKENFPCLIFSDVDLLPLRLGNIYACTNRPRHMSSSLDTFRFNLPYYGLFGGAVAVTSDVFVHVNGFSNLFYGWGGEDDDFYRRLVNKNYKIIRFNPRYSQYTMLTHLKENPNPDRIQYLKNGFLRYETDGLNSLVYREVGTLKNKLYTNVQVET